MTVLFGKIMWTMVEGYPFIYILPIIAVFVLYKDRKFINRMMWVTLFVVISGNIYKVQAKGVSGSDPEQMLAMGMIACCYACTLMSVKHLIQSDGALTGSIEANLARVVQTVEQVKVASNTIVDGITVVETIGTSIRHANTSSEELGEVAAWDEKKVFVAVDVAIDELSDRRVKEARCQLRVVVDNVLYCWEDVEISMGKSDDAGNYVLAVETNPQVFNRRKYPRFPLTNLCTVRVTETDLLCCGNMVNISANGFAFTVREPAFAELKGQEVTVEIDDFPVLKDEYLLGSIIRCSNNDGEYIVGCRMSADNKEIEEYVNRNYSE